MDLRSIDTNADPEKYNTHTQIQLLPEFTQTEKDKQCKNLKTHIKFTWFVQCDLHPRTGRDIYIISIKI